VPGLRSTETVLLPPVKVGVAPTWDPLGPWMVMLWGSEDAFVNLIVSLPALAVSELLVNFSCPVGSAAWVIVLPPPPPVLGADEEVDDEEEEEEDAGALDDDVLLLLLELPHAASPSASAAVTRERAENLGTGVPLVWDLAPG
jgi:hypothetical protein